MKTINLWPKDYPAGKSENKDFIPTLDIYTLDTDEPKGAVVICPGGGYAGRAPHEGKDIALRFNEFGFHAFVVQYRVAPDRFPAPQRDIFRAVKLVRSKAEEWNSRPDKIAVCGFSAGGHLAASSGTLFNEVQFAVGDETDKYPQKPNALILCYPVISSGEHGHSGSFDNLLGAGSDLELREKYSLEKRISAETPPTFLWHTGEDSAVPVENSLFWCQGLRKYRIPFELHIFPEGRHGLGLGVDDKVPELRVWPGLCATWLRKMQW
ncbi:MAG: alpha/beta hydrolase [Victivallaceae bacterium]|nr:alpha/beta hydrolase [Victivallaceae bacterium]